MHTGPDCTVASTALSRQRDCAACSCSADCTAGQCRTTTTQQAAQASFLSHFCSCFTSVVPHTTPGWGTSRCCTLITRPCPSRGTPRKLVRSLASDLACVYHKRTAVLQAAQPAEPVTEPALQSKPVPKFRQPGGRDDRSSCRLLVFSRFGNITMSDDLPPDFTVWSVSRFVNICSLYLKNHRRKIRNFKNTVFPSDQ